MEILFKLNATRHLDYMTSIASLGIFESIFEIPVRGPPTLPRRLGILVCEVFVVLVAFFFWGEVGKMSSAGFLFSTTFEYTVQGQGLAPIGPGSTRPDPNRARVGPDFWRLGPALMGSRAKVSDLARPDPLSRRLNWVCIKTCEIAGLRVCGLRTAGRGGGEGIGVGLEGGY
jgi:hypothetical protein